MGGSAWSIASGVLIYIGFLLVPYPALADQTSKQVLTTIKPLQLLVKAIGGDFVEVDLLLPSRQSPHNYQLRPSDRRKLAEAEQIYWIGPSMETFLLRSIESLPQERIETLGKNLPATHGDHSHDTLENDPHIWIDYSQIIVMSEQIEKSLSRLLPEHARHFTKNRTELISQLDSIDGQFKKSFAEINNKALVLSHASYQRFLMHYGLFDNIALSDMHGRTASIKQWQRIENYMLNKTPNCFLLDPSERNSMQDSFLQRYKMNVIEADPMAAHIDTTKSGFMEFYRQLAGDVLHCMKVEMQ